MQRHRRLSGEALVGEVVAADHVAAWPEAIASQGAVGAE